MARKTVLVSDLTGNEIQTPARVTVTYADARQGVVVLDVDASEVAELTSKGHKQKRRGRPKANAVSEPETAVIA